MRRRMDAAGAVDAQNAPTAPWKTAQNAVSHSAHTHHRFSRKKEQNDAVNPLHTRNSGQSLDSRLKSISLGPIEPVREGVPFGHYCLVAVKLPTPAFVSPLDIVKLPSIIVAFGFSVPVNA